MTEEDNFRNLCNLTTRLLGLPDNSLSLKSRKQYLQIARSIVAVITRQEHGTHRKIIGKVLNRDRSLIYHYEKNHKGNYATWEIYRETFNKVYTAYKNLSDSKETFLEGIFLKRHLLKNGVKEKLEHQVLIQVKSGDATCLVKTSYFDFSNQLNNIKLALNKHHYSIQII